MEVEIAYRRDDGIEWIRSKWVTEDSKYLFLASGKYLKTRILSMDKIPDKSDDEDKE